MRLDNINKYYIVGILPFTTVIFILSLLLSYNRKTVFYSLLMVGVLTTYQLVKKFTFLPRPLEEYKDLKEIKPHLPIKYDVRYFTSKDFDKYPFFPRIVEILSPLYLKEGEKLKVVINESLLKNKNEPFIYIAICREIEKYRTKSQVKIILTLVTPILMVIIIVLWSLFIKINLSNYLNPFILYFILPSFTVILFLSHLFFWNRYVTVQEAKLDEFLTSYFHIDDVEKYIKHIEGLEGGAETSKHREFNSYYAKQRLKKLKKAN
ncbi:hypothetical protein [Natronincola ferrireducens]|uniref:Uncharacterized protein n=1 Tax=Natronincola ferrireducens TaxID=393762 RepID=A0A1G8YSV1_9FIRM|nr:hypothetical protein [Natronincola ferrireducens]SDK05524.1 hypothetical protein SAMN05660472_00630 [Natronincola ferrireducens]